MNLEWAVRFKAKLQVPLGHQVIRCEVRRACSIGLLYFEAPIIIIKARVAPLNHASSYSPPNPFPFPIPITVIIAGHRSVLLSPRPPAPSVLSFPILKPKGVTTRPVPST